MKTRVFVSSSAINLPRLRQFLVRFEGRWDPENEQVVVERGRAVVYIGMEAVETLPSFEIVSAESKLEGDLGGFVVVDVGHAQGSDALAEEIEQAMIVEWGGVCSGDQLFPDL